MEFLANALEFAATRPVDPKATWWLVWDEPVCPEELI